MPNANMKCKSEKVIDGMTSDLQRNCIAETNKIFAPFLVHKQHTRDQSTLQTVVMGLLTCFLFFKIHNDSFLEKQAIFPAILYKARYKTSLGSTVYYESYFY
jgi:hypothetical protein